MRNVAEKTEFDCFQQRANLPQKWPKNSIFILVDQVLWTSSSILSHLEVLDILYHWNLTLPFEADIAVHTINTRLAFNIRMKNA